MMNKHLRKYYQCEHDQGVGVMLVDLESESVPRQDAQGRQLYYCLKGHHVFSVTTDRVQIPEDEDALREVTAVS
jgi:hypothetical protein